MYISVGIVIYIYTETQLPNEQFINSDDFEILKWLNYHYLMSLYNFYVNLKFFSESIYYLLHISLKFLNCPLCGHICYLFIWYKRFFLHLLPLTFYPFSILRKMTPFFKRDHVHIFQSVLYFSLLPMRYRSLLHWPH